MKLKVTKAMANALNKVCQFDVSLQKLSENAFSLLVSYNAFMHDEDYDIETGRFSVIRVEYPDDYYAMPKYVTTQDLKLLGYGCDTFEQLVERFNNYVEI